MPQYEIIIYRQAFGDTYNIYTTIISHKTKKDAHMYAESLVRSYERQGIMGVISYRIRKI